jgi:3D (Asp-Asp-Asp) domain-containing protein
MAVTATDETVGDLLSRLGISVDGETDISVPLEMDTQSGMTITISRTLQDVQTYTAAIAHDVSYYHDYSLPMGTELKVREGRDGQLLCTANVVYVDGKETNRTVVEQTVIQQPVEEIIAIGMGCDPLPPKDPGSELVITDRHIFLPNGEVLTYTGTTRMLGSAYSQYDQGCGTITYSGTTVHIGTVAVDPRWIPLGTRMFIVSADGDYVYGIATAEDTGSSILEARVDLYFPTQAECLQFGMRDVIIYFLG